MSLSASRLAGVIKPDLESKIRSYILGGDATAYPNLTNFCQAVADSIAAAVIAEVTTNAVVNKGAMVVNPGTLVANTTTGAITGQGTITGTGTIT